MSRALFVINGPIDRRRAAALLEKCESGTRVEFKAAKRSLPQNSRLWAMLTDVARQLEWHGTKLRADDWKLVFLDAFKREARLVPNIDGTGFVNISTSSSDLTKDEMSNLIELIAEFGTRHGVSFNDDRRAA